MHKCPALSFDEFSMKGEEIDMRLKMSCESQVDGITNI